MILKLVDCKKKNKKVIVYYDNNIIKKRELFQSEHAIYFQLIDLELILIKFISLESKTLSS